MAKQTQEEVINLQPIATKVVSLTIEGTSDLILNKMNARNALDLWNKQIGLPKDKRPANMWEDIVTSLHWRDPLPEMEREDYTEETLNELLKNNAPCITSFGLKKAFADALVRNNVDKYATKFNSTVNIEGVLIPITFVNHYIDNKLMSPQKGSPVITRLNRFSNWTATFKVIYNENVYSLEQIIDIINLAGFGSGIGSGRSSGYGRFKISQANLEV